MLLQSLVVALIVAACGVYAAWTLMPAAWRRAAALALLKLPMPAGAAGFLRRHSVAASGCACDGCDKGSPAKTKRATTGVLPITFHPRRQR